MSLSKQLSLGFLSILLLMFLGTLWTTTTNTRDFVSAQLFSHSQDTATSLGLSISPHLANQKDLAIIETMVSAIFDSGYYTSIELQDLNGNLIISLSNTDTVDTVPKWFSSMFFIQAPFATSEINNGWNISATISVTSHTGLAYKQLWSNTVNMFWLSLVMLLLSLSFVWLIVKHIITRPVQLVIKETEGISQQKFTQISEVPKTPELKRIVVAVNLMSSKLSSLFRNLSEQAEKYRKYAYTDALTKLGNRRAFELHMQQVLRDEQEHASGHIFIIRASSLADLHNALGGAMGDQYLEALSLSVQQITGDKFEHYSIYRISGADFAIVLENSRDDHATSLAKELALAFKRIEKSEYKQGTAHIGITQYAYGDNLEQLLIKSDSALSVAKNSNASWEFAKNLALTHSNEQWRIKIDRILSVGTSDFVGQPIIDKESTLEYTEWFARLPNEKSSANLPMAQLIPASIRLDHAQKLDKLIIDNLLKQFNESHARIGVNISRLSIFDVVFMDWFVEAISKHKDLCANLTVEIPERALVHDIDSLVIQVKRLKALNIKITVEHFGAQLAGIMHLRALQPDYLKLDGRFTKNIHLETDNQLFVSSLVNIAHGLNIQVIAEMVETQAEKEWLIDAKLDFLQGYYIASPKPVKAA